MHFDSTFIYDFAGECRQYNTKLQGKEIYKKLSKPLVLEVLLSRENQPNQLLGSRVLDWRPLIHKDT